MKFSTAAVFSDHMVLQRNENICVFGTGDGKSEVTVSILKEGKVLTQNKTSVYDSEGKWKVYLDKLEAMDGLELKAECNGECKTFTDVVTGEVWLAGGQSNMEFELHNCTEGPDELKNEKNPNVRFYYTNKIAWMDEAFYEAEKNTCWQTWDSEWKTAWSAVGYFFAKRIAAETGVTVGVIGCNWGGTSASCWMSEKSLTKDEDLKTYVDEQIEATKGKSIEQQCAEYDAYVAANQEWQKKCDALYAKNPDMEWADVQKEIGVCEWPGPRSCKNPFRPNGLYETMLKRVMPYSLKGFIWYQGESDDHKPAFYYKLFKTMLEEWRKNWNDVKKPFIMVQLPEHRYKQDKDYKNWPVIRESQMKVFQNTENVGLAVAAEQGVYNDIHPKAKAVVAERLALQALWFVYEKISAQESNGPIFKNAVSKGGKLILHFDYAQDGFVYRDDPEAVKNYVSMEKTQGITLPDGFNAFEIAGADKKFVPANFTLSGSEGKDTIVLESDAVKEPVYARYAWYNYGPVTVFGANGLPLAPFRTCEDDDTFVTNEHAAIQQVMEV